MKICVLFPGIGYTTEMPLMYYPGKMTMGLGYELIRLKYHDLPSGVKGNKEKMKLAFDIACEQSLEQLYGSAIYRKEHRNCNSCMLRPEVGTKCSRRRGIISRNKDEICISYTA